MPPSTAEDSALAAKRKEIEEKVRLAKEKQAAEEQQRSAAAAAKKGPAKGLTREELIKKLDAVPLFVVLNESEKVVLSIDDTTGISTVFWHIEPASAKEQLDTLTKQNPDATKALHLGVMSLGVAWPLYAGWEESVETNVEHADNTGAPAKPPKIRHSLVTEPVKGLSVPVYVCGEMQNEESLPVYFNKRDLASAWVRSGRSAKDFTNDKLMAVELAKFLDDMQKPVYSLWHTVKFITSGAAVAVLRGQAAANKQVDERRAAATAAAEAATEQAVAVS